MNTMSTEKKKYELKARAQTQQETRDKITRAAVELHGEKGVALTTVAEIARRAGVSRLTVYNHFPDLETLLPACSAHYDAEHPFPDLAPVLAVEDPSERVNGALRLIYAWYRETESMYSKVFAARFTVPEVEAFVRANADRALTGLVTALASAVASGRRKDPARLALLRVALDFWTWWRLDQEGLDDSAAARIMTEAVLGPPA